jgi:hypothetical protein
MPTDERNAPWRTKAFLTEMSFKAAGWNPVLHDAHASSEPTVYVYCYDAPTKWSWMCTVPVTSFLKTSQAGFEDTEHTEDFRGGLSFVMANAAEGIPPAQSDELDWERQLAVLLTLYAGGTQIWQMVNRFADGGHFIVLNYRKPGSRDGMLRPAALPPQPNESIISSEYFRALVEQVMAQDRNRHPEWFK